MSSIVETRTRLPRRGRPNWAFITTVALLFVLLFPLYWMLMTAVLPSGAILSREPALLPIGHPISFDSFASAFTNTPVLKWLGQSLIVTVGAAVLSTAMGIFAAYAMSRFAVPGQKLVAFTFLMGRVLPGTLLALPFFVLFQVAGLLDTSTAVILANTSAITPLTALMMKSYFDGIPRELDEAAQVDGCNRFMVLWRVLLPISGPGIAAGFGYAATSAWTDLLFSKTLLLSNNQWTVPLGIANLIGDVGTNWSELMAVGAISVLPVFVVYWFLQPYLVSGMTAGGVKG